MSDVRPPNDQVSYSGDLPWHVPFPSPPLTPNHDPTSSGSEAESTDPLDKISAVKHDLQYLSKATDWWESKCENEDDFWHAWAKYNIKENPFNLVQWNTQ
ncbi:hypothetical protein ACE6H2_001876 [Prunus campanulata]